MDCMLLRHEDIRRSIEVLDSVLAEFDDCLESWDTHTADHKGSLTRRNIPSEELKLDGNRLFESLPCGDTLYNPSGATDGSTNHNGCEYGMDQSHVSSPPPIPKRSPTTRLSEYSPEPFRFPPGDPPGNQSDDVSPQGSVDLSPPPTEHVKIRRQVLSSTDFQDDGRDSADCCSNCGRALRHCDSSMDLSTSDSPSLFLRRKQVFESMSSSRDRKISDGKNPLELTAEPNLSSESGIDNDSGSFDEISDCQSNSDGKANGFESFSTNGSLHVPNCCCSERIRSLSSRFSETRRLLKLNKIKGLESRPPSFLPPPTPEKLVNGFSHRLQRNSTKSLNRTNGHLETDTCNSNQASPKHVQSSLHQSRLSISTRSIDGSIDSSFNQSRLDWTGSLESLRLCNRCSSNCSETAEDIPKLLPTDALNRPYLGLSYSMEDDLSPGVKEISQVVTSTPKSDQESPSLDRSKDGLSTFSHSASSLGYSSSQSDWELNQLPNVPDKVPVSTFRSRTLPNGLDRSPFYSAAEEFYFHPKPMSPRIEQCSTDEGQSRSSSAPPPPEVEKPKKHFRVFSRKSKKNKSGATP